MNTPEVSVIVPVFEQLDTLPLVCDSLAGQDYRGRWELIVCDDGSKADYRNLLRRQAARLDGNVRFVWQPHDGRGVARSRNNAIRCARGDLLVFLDGDCLAGPHFLSTHAAAHSSGKRLLCGARKFLFMEPGDMEILRIPNGVQTVLRRSASLNLPSMREWQDRVFADAPWRACMSCNISVPAGDEIHFDEHFTGWGSEDVEFACRLYYRHGYEVVTEPVVDCYTIEAGPAHTFRAIRPRSHDDIVSCLRDLLYFQHKHRDLPVQSIMRMCRHFALESGRWRQLEPDESFARAPQAAADAVTQWFAEHDPKADMVLFPAVNGVRNETSRRLT